jgi:hypothetical protein
MTPSFEELLRSAVEEPGTISRAFGAFDIYSLRSQPERSAQRILKAADQILRAGRADAEVLA